MIGCFAAHVSLFSFAVMLLGHPSLMASDIDGLANVLEADLGKHKEQIIRMMLRCVTELPTKTPIYGTLAGLLNVKNMDFGADLGARSSHKSLLACVLCIVCCSHESRTSYLGLVAHRVAVALLGEQLQAALEAGDSLKVKMMVRFAGELVNSNVIAPLNFLALLDRFVDAALDSATAAASGARAQERSDFFVLVALGSLPWAGRQLAEGRPAELNRQLKSVETYIARRSRAMNDVVTAFGEGSGARQDFLEALWQQVSRMRERDWNVPCVPRPHTAFEGRLSLGAQHALPAISLPPHSAKLTYPVSRGVFRLFDAAESEKVTLRHSLAQSRTHLDTQHTHSRTHRASQILRTPHTSASSVTSHRSCNRASGSCWRSTSSTCCTGSARATRRARSRSSPCRPPRASSSSSWRPSWASS